MYIMLLCDSIIAGYYIGASGVAAINAITLAVVISLIEFSVVMDGVGMAIQPLIGIYFGEKNHQLIKRVMKAAIKAALIEGVTGTVTIY
ncbi:MAG: hypothetical protein K5770_11515 [Lachnospiraceae bacterium]|nr:hypothetical protein [Lachnospiraceae bacterium]